MHPIKHWLLPAVLIAFSVIAVMMLWSSAPRLPQEITLQKLQALAQPSRHATLLFAGDVMLGRNVGRLIAAHGSGFPFEKIATATDALAPDLFIANLEGPITTLDTDASNTMRFQFDPSVLKSLTLEGFTHLSVANNHWFDQGEAGADDTIRHLQSAHIDPIGFRDGSVLGTVSREEVDGRTIILVALDATITPHDKNELSHALQALPKEAFVVAFLHWGNEYEREHSPQQEALAHFLIDNGIDLVIGSHPHVVQDVGTYKGKAIFYSLGNFVFDQYWNDDVQTGLMVRAVLDGDTVAYDEIPIVSIHSQPHVQEGTTTSFNLPID